MKTYSLRMKRLNYLQEMIEWNASEVADCHSESVLLAPRKPVAAFHVTMWKKGRVYNKNRHLLESGTLKKHLKSLCVFKICKSAHHRTIQINHKPDATIFQFIILTFVYSSTCFGCFPGHYQKLNDCSGSLWFYLGKMVITVLCSWSGRPV
jgi:hypothetical protein